MATTTRHGPARLRFRGVRRPALAAGPVTLGLLVLLSIWTAAYQLTDTVAIGWLNVAPFDGLWPDVAFGLGGMLVIARGWRENRGWVLIGIGALCWAAGDVYWQLALSSQSSPPVPSWADAGYLAFCPFTFAGILSVVGGRVRSASRLLIADALAAGLAAGAASAAIVVAPVLDHARGGSLAIATNLAYPICDLALLGLLVGVIAVGEWRLSPRLLVLGASVLAFWIADSAYLVASAKGTYSVTDWYNGLWYLSPALAAWAARLPARSRVNVVEREASARGIVLLLAFAIAAMAVLVASSATSVGVPAIILATLALLVVLARLVMTWRDNVALLHTSRQEAVTDALTGLRNRRALTADLASCLREATAARPAALVLFDLDGFKYYNDSFGHPAGDALLQRLGARLGVRLADVGVAYRMGGDEFCALIRGAAESLDDTIRSAACALSESGEGFAIGCSYGSVVIPSEADSSEAALRLADFRMYTQKRGGRASASCQSRDVLLQLLEERSPQLHTHVRDVADLAVGTAVGLGLPAHEAEEIRQAAELHDVGKAAIPDAILDKPGPLDQDEWRFIRRHTVIGERIVSAAPALLNVARMVRSSHENFDGTGYPDELRGDEIPLGSRIILVCDAFDAMTSDRPYHKGLTDGQAIDELRRCAGTQFDPAVVEEFCRALARHDQEQRIAHAA